MLPRPPPCIRVINGVSGIRRAGVKRQEIPEGRLQTRFSTLHLSLSFFSSQICFYSSLPLLPSTPTVSSFLSERLTGPNSNSNLVKSVSDVGSVNCLPKNRNNSAGQRGQRVTRMFTISKTPTLEDGKETTATFQIAAQISCVS